MSVTGNVTLALRDSRLSTLTCDNADITEGGLKRKSYFAHTLKNTKQENETEALFRDEGKNKQICNRVDCRRSEKKKDQRHAKS